MSRTPKNASRNEKSESIDHAISPQIIQDATLIKGFYGWKIELCVLWLPNKNGGIKPFHQSNPFPTDQITGESNCYFAPLSERAIQ